jgi:hypothetical protein
MSDWQTEFPNLYNLKHNPKAFAADFFCGLERKLRRLITLVTLTLMGYVVYQTLVNYYGSGVSDIRDLPTVQLGQVLTTWKIWRNILFGFLAFDLVLVVVSSVISVTRKQYARLVKTAYGYAFLMMFLVPFSYPLAMVIASSIAYFSAASSIPPSPTP